ncbi:MAG: hypothetical protein AAB628_02060 [Patescibacteria group bacterium]
MGKILPYLVLALFAFAFALQVLEHFNMPTVYKSSITRECVKATDADGGDIPCNEAKKGRYETVWK